MNSRKKLKIYIESKGIRPSFFAKKCGVSRQFFHSMLTEKKHFPIEIWSTLIELSEGHISLKDLLEDRLETQDKPIDIHSRGSPFAAIVFLKENDK